MKTLTLKRDGLWVRKWNSDRYDAAREAAEEGGQRPDRNDESFWDVYQPEGDTIWTYLRDTLEVDADVTVLDVFDAVDRHPLLKAFVAQYSWCKGIDAIHKQARQTEGREDDDYSDLEVAELYYHATATKSKKSGNYLGGYWGFHALGKAKRDCEGGGYKAGDNLPWSISASPAYQYCHLPIKVSGDYKLHQTEWVTKRKLEQTTLFEGTQTITLLEFLDAIYWDISFYGTPEESAEVKAEMVEAWEQIKADIDNRPQTKLE